MDDRKIYTKAAELVFTGMHGYSCFAIWQSWNINSVGKKKHHDRYRAAFGFPEQRDSRTDWFTEVLLAEARMETTPEAYNERLTELRVWCLLVMAAACRDL